MWSIVFKGAVQPQTHELMTHEVMNYSHADGKVEFRCSLNISGASQRNSVAAFSQTTEVTGDLRKK